jgi:glycine cleavage system H lipoate-binding protein
VPERHGKADMIAVRGCMFPDDRCYDARKNVWLKSEDSNVVLLGATSFGVALASEFLAFIPKPIGTLVEADRAVGLLELAKTIVSVRTPIAGEIVAFNQAAVVDPSIINADPYEDGWLVKLKVDNWGGAKRSLVSGSAIAPAFEEAMRLENFEGREE